MWLDRLLLYLNSGSASFKGLGLCGLRRRVLRRDLVNRVSRCQMGRSRLWSISWLRHQMFYPYVTISAAQAHESDDLRRAMLPFSLFCMGHAKNFGICEATKDSSGASSEKNRNEGRICGLHLKEPSNWDSLCVALWRNWPSSGLQAKLFWCVSVNVNVLPHCLLHSF